MTVESFASTVFFAVLHALPLVFNYLEYTAGNIIDITFHCTGEVNERIILICARNSVQLYYLELTVQEKLRSGSPSPFLKVEGCCG
jgi:hypothetical protein